MADSWTVLTSLGPRLTKRVTLEGIEPYENAKRFTVGYSPVDGVASAFELLKLLALQNRSCVVWGKPTTNESPLERRKENFTDGGHQLLPIDMDLEQELQVSEVVQLLPPEFRGASYVAQWTSSQGVKPGTRLRLFFWLDHPISGQQAAAWLANTGADVRIYRVVQPIYTASPVFVDRVDPVGDRLNVYHGERDTVTVPAIEVTEVSDDYTPVEPRKEISDFVRQALVSDLAALDPDVNRDSQIGDWIIKAVAHGMPDAEIIAHGTAWLDEADPGRSSVQPREVTDWITSAHRGLRDGKFRIHEWYTSPEEDFADTVSEDATVKEKEILRGFVPVKFSELKGRDGIRKPNWLIEGILPAHGVGLLYSPPNVGKTFVTLSMLGALSQGIQWLGHAVKKQGLCCYLHGEGGTGVVNRLEAWRIVNEATDADMERLIVHDPRSIDRPLDLSDPRTIGAACRQIKQLATNQEVSIVVVDTFASMSGASDENDNSEMGRTWGILHRLSRELSCLVLVVHHTGRASSDRARGASAIDGTLDVSIRIEGEPGADRLAITCSKMRDGKWFEPIKAKFEQVELRSVTGEPISQQALVADNEKRPWTREHEVLLLVLRDLERTPNGAIGSRYARLKAEGAARSEVDSVWPLIDRYELAANVGGRTKQYEVTDAARACLWQEQAPLALQLLMARIDDESFVVVEDE